MYICIILNFNVNMKNIATFHDTYKYEGLRCTPLSLCVYSVLYIRQYYYIVYLCI